MFYLNGKCERAQVPPVGRLLDSLRQALVRDVDVRPFLNEIPDALVFACNTSRVNHSG